MNLCTRDRNYQNRVAALATLVVFLCGPAWATLGQTLPSGSATPVTRSTAARVNAAGVSTTTAGTSSYGVRSTTMDSGTVVSEYATPAGLVFAISWQGPTLPDLSALLGNYFPTFQSEAAASRSQRSLGTPLLIQTNGLVVRSRGRMGDFSGQAWAPALIPADVNIADVLP
jgi:hypothetical protein